MGTLCQQVTTHGHCYPPSRKYCYKERTIFWDTFADDAYCMSRSFTGWAVKWALLAQAAKRKKLAMPGATGSKVVRVNEAMQYLTENSRFAGAINNPFAHFSSRLSPDEDHSTRQYASSCASVNTI